MLRLSFVCSVCVHVALLGVMSVVLAHNAQEQPEKQGIHVRMQTQNVVAPQVSSKPAEPVQSPLPVVTSPPIMPPLQPAQAKQQAVQEAPKPVRTMPRPLNARVRQPERERSTPPAPKDVVTVARAFPTPLPTPSPLPTPVPTPLPKPTAIPEPTPVLTPTPEPTATIQPIPVPNTPVPNTPVPKATITPRPAATAIVQRDEQTKSPAAVQSTPQVAQRAADDIVKTREPSPEIQPQALSAEQQQTLLKAYVKQIVTDIQAVKTYPRNARRKGWEGTVIVKVHILAAGTLKEAVIAQTSGYKFLDKAALETIREIQPFAEFPEGVSMPSLIVNIPIQFTLK